MEHMTMTAATATNTAGTATSEARSGTVYISERGWKYRVMGGIGGGTFKARYQKPGKSSWKGLAQLPWRDTFEEAQADLDRLAQTHGWKPWEKEAAT